MIQTDRQYYRAVMSAVGCTMLMFLLFVNIFGVAIVSWMLVLEFLPIGDVARNVIYELSYAAGYMVSFMLPVLFLRRFLRKKGCQVQPMSLAPRLSPMLVPILFAGLAVCFSMAQINAAIMGVFEYSGFTREIMPGASETMEPYEIVLEFIVISIVPAFCEEFLFRGAILSNLRPFGRTNAVVISAVLFALMHQNAGQLLYTFAAGIVLGLIYEYTGSIWNCTILHLLNNFVSVVQDAIFAKHGESEYAEVLVIILDVAIFVVGAVSLGILIHKHFSKRPNLEEGVFEKTVLPADDYAEHPIRGREAAKMFFCPSMVLFVIFAVGQMALLILLSFSI